MSFFRATVDSRSKCDFRLNYVAPWNAPSCRARTSFLWEQCRYFMESLGDKAEHPRRRNPGQQVPLEETGPDKGKDMSLCLFQGEWFAHKSSWFEP